MRRWLTPSFLFMLALLADADDPTQWTTQAAFGLSEGVYMILTGPAGDS